MKGGFKRKMGISYWVFELWAGLEWTGGKWIKWALEKERKTVAERVRKGGSGTVEKFLLARTLTDRLDGQTTSISTQILRRCSTRREEQSYDGQLCF